MTFTVRVRVDGTDIAPITLAGATIDYGRTSVLDQPSVPVAVLEILTRDAYPIAADLYPEFGLGDWASDLSGFTDLYADVYTGAQSRITLGVPVTIDVESSGGFTDTYTDLYEGYYSRRHTGTVQAIDYTPGLIQLTVTAPTEKWARLLVGGTDATTTIGVETETARARRLALEAGIDLIVEGPPSVELTEIPPDTEPRPLLTWLQDIAEDADAVLYTDRTGFVHFRTRDFDPGTPDTVFLPPGATLLDPLMMSTDLGLVRNHITTVYGAKDVDGDRPTVVSIDQPSIDRYGQRDLHLTTSIANQDDAQAHADLVNTRLSADWRMPDAVIAMQLLPDDPWKARIFDIDQGDPVIVPRLLPGSPMPDYPANVIGYTEELAREDWRVTFHLAARPITTLTYSPGVVYSPPISYEGKA